MVSERKLLANRGNAKRSTGPKDTRRTKYNAQKHGLLSQAAIIQDGDAKEDPRELRSLVEALRKDLGPEGAMEEMLVDRISSCVWRLRRAQRAEVGEIRRGADSTVMDTMRSIADRYDSASDLEEMIPFIVAGGRKRELSRTTHGIAHMKRVLDRTRALVEEQGRLTKGQLAEAIRIYGDRMGSVAGTLLALSTAATGGPPVNDHEKPGTGSDFPSPERCKELLLSLIDREMARLKDEAELMAEREKLELDAAVLSLHLPSDDVLAKILRYETAIDRQMYRALNELRELQAARRARSTLLGSADNGV